MYSWTKYFSLSLRERCTSRDSWLLTLFGMGLFGAAHVLGGEGPMGGKKAPLPKICYTFSILMKLVTIVPYLQKIHKLYKSRDTPHEFCCHQYFFTRNPQLLSYQLLLYTDTDCILIHSFYFFSHFLSLHKLI